MIRSGGRQWIVATPMVMLAGCAAIADRPEWSTSRRPSSAQKDQSHAYQQLATSYHRQNRPKLAEPLYRAALRSNPGNAELHYRLGDCLARMGQREEAIRSLQEATQLSPGNADYQSLLGILLRWSGRNEEALAALERAWASNPPSVDAGLELARWHLEHDRPDRSRPILEICRLHRPDHPEIEQSLAESLEKLGDLSAARSHWQSLADRGELGATPWRHLTAIHEALGEAPLADGSRQYVQRLSPEQMRAPIQLPKLTARSAADREYPPWR